MESPSKDYPLILVMYLDRELMAQRDIMTSYAEYVNGLIADKEANMMTFFLPTDGEERIECVNPVQIEPAKMDKIMRMIDEITTNFLDIGQGADEGKNDPNNEVEVDSNE